MKDNSGFIPLTPGDVYEIVRQDANAEAQVSEMDDLMLRLERLAGVKKDMPSVTEPDAAEKLAPLTSQTAEFDPKAELDKLDPPVIGVNAEELKGEMASPRSIVTQTGNVLKGAVDFLDFVTTPLSALTAAIQAPIANNAQGIKEAATISTKAFMDRLSANPLNPDAQPPEHYAATIVDNIAPDAGPAAKGALTATVDLLTDPTLAVGLPFIKVLQRGMRTTKELAETGKLEANKGIIYNGVAELLGAIDQTAIRAGAADFSKTADKAKELAILADNGDKEAARKLNAILESDKILDGAARNMDVADQASRMTEIDKAMGKPSAPIYEFNDTIKPGDLLNAYAEGKTPEIAGINLNLRKINTEEDVNKLLASLAEKSKPYLAAHVKGTSHKEELAKTQLTSLIDIIGKPVTAMEPHEALTARIALTASAEQLLKLAKRAKETGSKLDMFAFNKALAVNKVLQAKVTGTARHAGQLLNTYNIEAKSNTQALRSVSHVINTLQTNEHSSVVLRDLLAGLNDTTSINRFIAQSSKLRKLDDATFEVFANSALSGPITHGVNVASNGMVVLARPTEKFLQSLSATARLDFTQAQANLGEAGAMLHGVLQGVTDALRLTFKQTDWNKLELPVEMLHMHELSRAKMPPKITSENLGVSGKLGAAVDMVGNAIRLPGFALVEEDKVFKLINYRMSVRRHAYTEARKAAGTDKDKFGKLYNILVNNPNDNTIVESVNDAAYFTFTNDLGSIGSKAAKLVHTPGLRYLIPFFATPTNIVKMGTRNSVVGNVFRDLKPALTQANAKGDIARAKIAMGTLIPAAILYMMGDDVTGHIDKKTPLGRFKANNLGDEYTFPVDPKTGERVSYEKLEPFRSIFGMLATYRDAVQHLNMDVDPDTGLPTDKAAELFSVVVSPFMQTITDTYMLQAMGGIMNMAEAMTSGNPEYIKKQLTRLAITASQPAFMRQINQAYLDNTFRKAEGYIQKYMAGVPGLSKKVPPRVTLWGDDQLAYDDIDINNLSPLASRSTKPDDIDKALVDLEVSLPRQPDTITINGIELDLTPEQQSRFAKLRGKGLEGGPTLKEIIGDLVRDPQFRDLPPKLQRERLEATFNIVTDNTKKFLFATDESLQEQFDVKQEALQSVLNYTGAQQ